MYSFNTRIVQEHNRIAWESSFQKLSNDQTSKVHQLICWHDKKKVAWLWADLFNTTWLTVILGQHRPHATVNVCTGTVWHSTDPDTPGWGHIIKQWVRLYAHLSPLSLRPGSADPPHPSWRSLSSRRRPVHGGFPQICSIPDFSKHANLSRTTRKCSGATIKHVLLPARPYWKLLECTGKMMSWDIVKSC